MKSSKNAQGNGTAQQDKNIGFCLVTAIPPCADPQTEPTHPQPGKPTEEVVNLFKSNRHLEENACAIEINKIGLEDKYTGQGFGNFYLAKMLQILFEREKYNIVYLNTRDTNHSGVLKFYAKNGISTFYTESLPNDLVKTAPSPREKPAIGERYRPINGEPAPEA